MKKTLRLTLATGLLAVGTLAFAHDPAEHAKEAAAAKAGPDCAAMDHSKMDMNDPVAKAMMAKCAGAAKAAEKPAEMKGMEGMDHSKMAKPDAAKPAAPHNDAHKGH